MHIFKRNLGNNPKLCSALNQLHLSFRARVVIQSYGADAVLQSRGNKAQPIIVTLGRPDCIRNIPGRLAKHMLLYAIFHAIGMPKQRHADSTLVIISWLLTGTDQGLTA
ncbi:hypothetical protein WJX82_011495 [Trebouxia sp. C0006]